MSRISSRLTLSLLLMTVVALPATAQENPPEEEPEPDWPVYEIVFPVVGDHYYSDTWGEARAGGRTHEGTDIMAEKLTPVVAAADGAVVEVRGFDGEGMPNGAGQWLIVDHGEWQTWYLHLNNDTPGSDDGQGFGVVPEILAAYVTSVETQTAVSYPVVAGQLIGWVGDSGNAEWSGPHLHFEIREGPGKWEAVAINSYPSLQAATVIEEVNSPAHPWRGRFSDDDDSVHEPDIERLAGEGITKGCNPPDNTRYCPQRQITRGEIAAFIRRTLDLPAASADLFTDDEWSVFEDDINALTEAGIGFGCTETTYCPDEPLLRGEMAEMLVRAFAGDDPDRYANPAGTDHFVDDGDSPYRESIDRLMAAGVTKGCNPPDNDRFCPQRALTRAEMASFFVRALEP